MAATIKPKKMEYILGSIHNEDGLEFFFLDQPQLATVKVRNSMEHSYHLVTRDDPGSLPTIRLDFNSAGGPVSLDADSIVCRGFRAASWNEGVLELTLAVAELWWFADDVITIEIPQFVPGGSPGGGSFDIIIENFDPMVDQLLRPALLKLSSQGRSSNGPAPYWAENNRVAVTPPNVAHRENELTLLFGSETSANGSSESNKAPDFYVTLPSGNASDMPMLTSPPRAEHINLVVETPGWEVERLEVTEMPVWKISAAPDTNGVPTLPKVVLQNVVSDQPTGGASVVVYNVNGDFSDGYTALGVSLVGSSVQITSFTVTPNTLSNIVAPTPVYLSWNVVNASIVTLSGVGVVSLVQQQMQVLIEETTTFILTAFDSALSDIVSQPVTVTVAPDLVTRLVPVGTIMLWSGLVTNIPPHWTLCNGSGPGIPDLRDRFIMGAGGSTQPNVAGDADTHTHVIAPPGTTFTTLGAGGHTHGMPSNWYARNLSSGSHTGIDSNGSFSTGTQSQGQSDHTHSVPTSFNQFNSSNNNGGVRPPWYALCYIMKVAS
jgi:hypothetical protein